jgi:hypothetical protein
MGVTATLDLKNLALRSFAGNMAQNLSLSLTDDYA